MTVIEKAREYAGKCALPFVSPDLSRIILDLIIKAYIAGEIENDLQWHKVFIDTEPYAYEYWDLPQENLPKNGNFYFVKLKNGFIKICELKYDCWSRKKYFYDLHGGKQSDVAEWLDYPTE